MKGDPPLISHSVPGTRHASYSADDPPGSAIQGTAIQHLASPLQTHTVWSSIGRSRGIAKRQFKEAEGRRRRSGESVRKEDEVAVGTAIARHPPHRSHRAAFPQRAPLLGDDGPAFGVWATHPAPVRAWRRRSTRDIRHGVRHGPADHAPLERAPSLHPLRRQQAGLVRGLQRYYAPVRLLMPVHRRRALLRASRRGPGPQERLRASMRSPRFRRVPFVRDGVSDPGRASAPRIAAPHILPSTLSTASASATL
jgi:hypothetical protein